MEGSKYLQGASKTIGVAQLEGKAGVNRMTSQGPDLNTSI